MLAFPALVAVVRRQRPRVEQLEGTGGVSKGPAAVGDVDGVGTRQGPAQTEGQSSSSACGRGATGTTSCPGSRNQTPGVALLLLLESGAWRPTKPKMADGRCRRFAARLPRSSDRRWPASASFFAYSADLISSTWRPAIRICCKGKSNRSPIVFRLQFNSSV